MTGSPARKPRRLSSLPGSPAPWAGRRSRRAGMLSALCLLLFLPAASLWAAAERGAPPPTAKDKCPVCGMFVAKYPDWLTALRFKDGSHSYFDGAKDLFKFLHQPQKYAPGRKPEEFDAVLVRDYYTLSWIDGRKAWYVLGSDVYGPMGRELIPLEKEKDAKGFLNDHKGQRIIRFSEATPEVVKALDE
ncbi:MAG: nitrous oxide reductase accessory protein NosL [Deltaproteobacteria bacterium]|nr:nitrous oxide reductase accessory protein NosL [Deltaproteobacteria bacterium]